MAGITAKRREFAFIVFRQTVIAWRRSWHCCIWHCSTDPFQIMQPCAAEEMGREPANVASNACQLDCLDMSKIKTILSIIFIFTILGCVSSAYPILLWWSRECVLYLIIIIKPEVWIINHCLGLGHETMVCTVCLTMFFWVLAQTD